MPQTRWDYIQRKKAESGQTGTATYDLPEKGYMRELMLTLFSTPTASTTPANPISDMITKIEIVDGGKTLKALTGNQIKGLSMIHGHNPLGSLEKNDNSVEGYDHFFIPMGGLYDGVNYAPDMGRFNNPQIKITWDSSITTTEFGATVAADTAPAFKVSILAELCSEPGIFTHGYVKSELLKEITQATNTRTIVEIPRGDKMVGLAIEGGYDALDFCEDFQEIKLDFGNGDWVPFHLREEEILQFQQMIFKRPFVYSWQADLESHDELDTHMGHLSNISLMVDWWRGEIAKFTATRKGVETVEIRSLGWVGTTTDEYKLVWIRSEGWAPFHLWYVPSKFLLGGEKDTIDTGAFGRIEIETLSGGSASTSSTPDYLVELLMT